MSDMDSNELRAVNLQWDDDGEIVSLDTDEPIQIAPIGERYDLAQSQIKAAEAAAYRLAADVASGWYMDNDEEDGIGVYEPILALISDDQQSALDAYVKTKVDEHTSKIVEAFRINMMRLAPEYSHEEFDAAIRAMKETPND